MKYLILALLFFYSSISISIESTSSVLLLNSYHPQYSWTQKLTAGVVDALSTSMHSENIHVEHMDSRRFVDDPDYDKKIKELLLYKYKRYEPDVIITSDDYAYNFILKNRDALFPGKPIVFCGVNIFDPNQLIGEDNITGILEGMEIEGNLHLITKLQPEVNQIILLGDTTGFGLEMTNKARDIKESWAGKKIDIQIWDSISIEELYRRVEVLPKTSAVLMLAMHQDSLGRYFSYARDLPEITTRSTVPVYGMWGMTLGTGVAGGYMNDPYEHGEEAGFLALAVLAGTDAMDIPIQPKSKFSLKFDYSVFKKYDLNLGFTSINDSTINKPISIYELYSREINVVIFFFGVLIFIINYLLVSIRKRVHIEKQLDHLNTNLELKVKLRTKEINIRNQELEKAHERMKELANTDMLTGLCNRRAGQREITAYIKRARIEGSVLSIALLDIDHFKKVNDMFGHQVGDDVLVSFSLVLKQAVRPSDRVYRWGGEEFLILLPGTDLEFSVAVCKRILKELYQYEFQSVGQVTASIGLSCLGVDDSTDSLIKRADDFLYKAKDSGRNQVVVK